MRLVSTTMLKPDMVLAKSIYHRECLILREGQTNLTKYVSNLEKMGIEYIYVEDRKSIGIEIPDAISEETRITCKRVLRETMNDFTSKSTLNVTNISEVIHNIIDDILSNPDVQVSLNDINSADEYTFSHSVSTTVYALLIANRLDYNKSMLEKLATGTLLHDIGKVLLDKQILFKEMQLTPDEFEYVKQHTTLGYEALKKCPNISELSRIISLYHHERMDAAGYPHGVPAETLHEFTRIVAIADVYDALTSDRCYRKKLSANQAVNHLMASSGTQFDTKLVATFIQQIAIYPNGSLVQLSTKQIAIVQAQNRSMPTRPIVRVIEDEYGNEIDIYVIDLVKELSITIVKSEMELQDVKMKVLSETY